MPSKSKNPSHEKPPEPFLTCRVTGKKQRWTAQYMEMAHRYGLTLPEFANNYVSRPGRRVIEQSNMTEKQVQDAYSLHPNITSRLKYGDPNVPPRAPRPPKNDTPTPRQTRQPRNAVPDTVQPVQAEGITPHRVMVMMEVEYEAPEEPMEKPQERQAFAAAS